MSLAKWCRTVIQSDGIFNLHRTTIMRSFSCVHFLRHLHLKAYMCIIYTCSQERFGSPPIYNIDVNRLEENKVKADVKISKRRPDVIYESYTLHIRHFLAPVSDVKTSCQVCKKNHFHFYSSLIMRKPVLPYVNKKGAAWSAPLLFTP